MIRITCLALEKIQQDYPTYVKHYLLSDNKLFLLIILMKTVFIKLEIIQ
ncbi:protein of unknown function [Maridesulfovibrio hydrothermalis AM13 = DSM 14728]|uniref:Uncharacterized protein n=1 Tax=Maridesulfovibrio hydrothermalis AM13 = DSM 14728 TaxID=1121451 RepID=L0R879_9BACT|nr:protein of unknown function [Maridesulfovibrio hydrothermalis AM13 = DSM 14728]